MHLYIYFIIAISLFTAKLASANYLVYGVKTDFPMNDGDTSVRDVYVNMGTNQGLKVGTNLDVYRSIPTSDNLNNKNAQNINFKIAKLKVIHAEAGVAVARILEVNQPSKDTPMSGFNSVMVGDTVDVSRK